MFLGVLLDQRADHDDGFTGDFLRRVQREFQQRADANRRDLRHDGGASSDGADGQRDELVVGTPQVALQLAQQRGGVVGGDDVRENLELQRPDVHGIGGVHEEGREVHLEQRGLHRDHGAYVLEHHVLRLGFHAHGEHERP